MPSDYLTVQGETEYGFEICRSSFICRLTRADNVEEALAYVAGIRKKYSDATHHCYAAVGTPESNAQKFSDDGEPSGTAGQPILNVLVKNKLFASVAVVTRYFGGVKLGAGGLVNAYTKAAAECVARAQIIKNVWSSVFTAELTYGEYRTAEKRFAADGIKTKDIAFGESVKLILATPAGKADALDAFLKELTLGQRRHSLQNQEYIIY